jgi:hypothetical protein
MTDVRLRGSAPMAVAGVIHHVIRAQSIGSATGRGRGRNLVSLGLDQDFD